MALALLMLATGIASAHATYMLLFNAISITTQDLVTITEGTGVSEAVVKYGWFHGTVDDAWTITHVDTSTPRVVHVVLVNAPELRKYIRYLTVKITVTDSATPANIKTAYITLTKAEAILDTTGFDLTSGSWTVDIEYWGYAWKGGGSLTVSMLCMVEAAEAV